MSWNGRKNLEDDGPIETAASRLLEDYIGPRDRGRKWRASLRLPVRLYPASQDAFEAVTENISEGGMFIKSTTTLPVGARLGFTLTDGSTLIRGFGEVKWLGFDENGASNGIGIGFGYLPDKSFRCCARLMRKALEQEATPTASRCTARASFADDARGHP